MSIKRQFLTLRGLVGMSVPMARAVVGAVAQAAWPMHGKDRGERDMPSRDVSAGVGGGNSADASVESDADAQAASPRRTQLPSGRRDGANQRQTHSARRITWTRSGHSGPGM